MAEPNLVPYQAISSGLQTGGNILSTIMTNKANKRENEAARAYNLDLWNKQNAYNTPAAQMQRYRDAGLNTNLMYGQGNSGNAAAPSAASPVHYTAPEVILPNVIDFIKSYQQVQNMGEQNELIRYQTGIASEMYRRAVLNNQYDFGDTSQIFSHGKNQFMWIDPSFLASKTRDDTYAYRSRYNKIMQGEWQNRNLEKLGDLREQEIGFAQALKPFNLTPHDPPWLRIMANMFTKIAPKWMTGIVSH